MRNINRFKGDNVGGLEVFYFTAEENIVRIPAAVNGKITQDIELKPDAVWYAFFATAGSLQYREPEQTDRNGKRFRMELKGYIAKDTPELSVALSELSGRRFVLIYKDHNGYRKLVGSKRYYLSFERDLDTANSPAGRNGVSFSFRGDSTQESIFYEGAFSVSELGEVAPPAPPSAVVRIEKGNGEVVATLLPGQVFVIESGFSFGFRIV